MPKPISASWVWDPHVLSPWIADQDSSLLSDFWIWACCQAAPQMRLDYYLSYGLFVGLQYMTWYVLALEFFSSNLFLIPFFFSQFHCPFALVGSCFFVGHHCTIWYPVSSMYPVRYSFWISFLARLWLFCLASLHYLVQSHSLSKPVLIFTVFYLICGPMCEFFLTLQLL